eukprot:8654792-Pyramimonas_sp.AAC.1
MRSRILKHLRRCPRCLAVLQAIEVPMDLQEAADRRDEEREAVATRKAMGHGATKALVPVQQIIHIKLADHIDQHQLQLSPAPPAA